MRKYIREWIIKNVRNRLQFFKKLLTNLIEYVASIKSSFVPSIVVNIRLTRRYRVGNQNLIGGR